MNTANHSSLVQPLSDGAKTLFLIRHAKSSWDNIGLDDFERPLNERGKNDAPKMAQRLVKKQVSIDAFVSSPAKRAKKTAEYFIKEFGRKEKEILFIPKLYHASVEAFYNTINEIDNKYNSVALFSHNPGITFFANELTESIELDNMPTCSVFAVQTSIKSWKDFKEAKKVFWFFDYPKNTNELT